MVWTSRFNLKVTCSSDLNHLWLCSIPTTQLSHYSIGFLFCKVVTSEKHCTVAIVTCRGIHGIWTWKWRAGSWRKTPPGQDQPGRWLKRYGQPFLMHFNAKLNLFNKQQQLRCICNHFFCVLSTSLACLEYLISGWRQTLENHSSHIRPAEAPLIGAESQRVLTLPFGMELWTNKTRTITQHSLALHTTEVGGERLVSRRWHKELQHIIRSNARGSGPFNVCFIITSFQYAAASLASSLLLLLQLNCVYSDYHLISSVAIRKQNTHKHNLQGESGVHGYKSMQTPSCGG